MVKLSALYNLKWFKFTSLYILSQSFNYFYNYYIFLWEAKTEKEGHLETPVAYNSTKWEWNKAKIEDCSGHIITITIHTLLRSPDSFKQTQLHVLEFVVLSSHLYSHKTFIYDVLFISLKIF